MRVIYTKFKDCSRKYRIKTTFDGNNFSLLLFYQTDAWSADTIPQDYLKSFSQKHGIDFNDYKEKLIQYFFNPPPNVIFTFQNNILEIVCTVNKMNIRFFSCNLVEADQVKCMDNILDDLCDERSIYENKLGNLKAENEKLKQTVQDYENKLREFVTRKNREDSNLYSNFVLILNEKKKRIQHLTELLDAFRENPVLPNPKVSMNSRKRKKGLSNTVSEESIKQEISDSSEEGLNSTDDYNTDNEGELSSKTKVTESLTVTTEPSARKKNIQELFEEDSPPRTFHSLGRGKVDISAPSTSKVMGNSKKKSEVAVVPDGTAAAGPSGIEINTQDYIDML